MLARRSIAETTRSAGVCANIAADGRSVLGGIGSVELPGCGRGCLNFAQQRARSHTGLTRENIQLAELRHGDGPAAFWNRATGQAGERSHDRNGYTLGRSADENISDFFFAAGSKDLVSLTGVAGSV